MTTLTVSSIDLFMASNQSFLQYFDNISRTKGKNISKKLKVSTGRLIARPAVNMESMIIKNSLW